MKLHQALNELGISHALKGYIFIQEAVKLRHEDPLGKIGNVYFGIAKKYNSTYARVERAIRHAIEAGWEKSDKKLYKTIFGYDRCKPTNAEFISAVARCFYEPSV